jgi:hypothetical protein
MGYNWAREDVEIGFPSLQTQAGMTLHIYMVLVGQAYTECVAKFNFHH